MKKIILMLVSFLFLSTGSLVAQEKNWKARVRVISVSPNESAKIQVIGGDVKISNEVVPELDFTYYFNKNWAAELILATTNHDVKAIGTSAGNIPLGDVWLLPPTLTFQYHLTSLKNIEPYIGAGINYTIFYNADSGAVVNNVKYDNTFGFALQTGLDIDLNKKWFLNFDLKKIFLNTTATVNATTALGATVDADVDIDPLILGFGFGMRF
ncbi:MAG: OmpW family protein [Flavobacteriales bacterium CG03_land_8_20_14_0_80_35_15]|nr:MAG: OmpW family protein [Flavobacteriales bacterium CG03_land_8_20_14_0_80_35_15]